MNSTRFTLVGLSLAACLAVALPCDLTALAQDGGSETTPEKPAQDAPAPAKGLQRERPSRQAKNAEKAAEKDAQAKAQLKAKWFDKLDKEDRAALDEVVGFAAPALPEGVEFLNTNFKDMKELRGKVVVVQTFTTRTAGGLVSLEKDKNAIAEAKAASDDVVLIAVHTPEAIDKAKAAIEKKKIELPIVLDTEGALCDGYGAYRKGLAYAIDRQGNVRYAGLSIEGITEAVKELAAEKYDESIEAKARPERPMTATVEFPTFNSPVGSAADLRGKQGPAPAILKWWNAAPNTDGKLVVIDFWATWCGPCRAAIPHMNEIARAYPKDVACMGISDESNSNFDEGVLKHRINKSDFAYAVGIDPQARMKNAFQIRGIPHVAIISSDGIVRWQGHPMSLDKNAMDQLVTANRALIAKNSGGSAANRWSRGKR